MDRQIESSIHGNYTATSRSLDGEHVDNQHLKLLEEEKQLSSIKNKLTELKIRFDTTPCRYQKEDYQKLIDLLTASLVYLYGATSGAIISSWSITPSDDLIPSEKLIRSSFTSLENAIDNVESFLAEQINSEVELRTEICNQLQQNIEELESLLQDQYVVLSDAELNSIFGFDESEASE